MTHHRTKRTSADSLWHQKILIDRSPEAKRVELLKEQNLSCFKCNNFRPLQGNDGTCKMKKNKIVKKYNICENYGKVLLS